MGETIAITWQTSLFYIQAYWDLERWDCPKPPLVDCDRTGTRTQVSRFFLQSFFHSTTLSPHSENVPRDVDTLRLTWLHCPFQPFGGWRIIFFPEPPDCNDLLCWIFSSVFPSSNIYSASDPLASTLCLFVPIDHNFISLSDSEWAIKHRTEQRLKPNYKEDKACWWHAFFLF